MDFSFLGIFLLTLISLMLIFVLENRNPFYTTLMVVILITLMMIGFTLYMISQRGYRKNVLFTEIFKDYQALDVSEIVQVQQDLLEEQFLFACGDDLSKVKLMKLLLHNSFAPITSNNQVKILTDGIQTFDEIKKALWEAENHIHLEYYIVRNDSLGNEIKDILIEKAKQGVDVRLIYDAVGGKEIRKEYVDQLRSNGIQVHAFLPPKLGYISMSINHRTHRKIIVVDGTIGFVGGLNIGDEYVGEGTHFNYWRDTHLMVKGEGAYMLQNIFLKDWYFVSGEKLAQPQFYPPIKEEDII